MVRMCGVVGGGVSLGTGFEVSNTRSSLAVSLPPAFGSDGSSQLLH